MKNYLYLFLVLVCSACATSTSYEVEDQHYNCLKENFQNKENANLDEIILEYENKLIEQGFLQDHSSASFLKGINAIAEKGGQLPSIPSTLSRSMLLSRQYNSTCSKDIQDSILLSNSRFTEVTKETKNVFTRIGEAGDIDPKSVVEGMAKIYKQEDFDHPLYRINVFFVISFLQQFENQDRGIVGGLKRPSSAPISEKWTMKLFLNKQNEIFINDEEVSFDQFTEKVDQFFARSRTESKQSKRIKDRGNYALGRAFINFGNEKETDYDFYLKVYKQLKNIHAKLLSELSMEVYNQPFDKLNKEQQKSIKGLQPWMVSESEPVGD